LARHIFFRIARTRIARTRIARTIIALPLLPLWVALLALVAGLGYLAPGGPVGRVAAQAPTTNPKLLPFVEPLPRPVPPVARPAGLGIPVVPCSDPRGCPDLVVWGNSLDDTEVTVQNFTANSCAVREGYATPGSNVLLRFTFTTPNRGPGDLIIGAVADHPEWFTFAQCHNHFHFNEYADYRLWTPAAYQTWSALRAANPDTLASVLLAAHPELQSQVILARKFGFCVIDSRPDPGGPTRPGPNYFSCQFDQGITVGWADEYDREVEGQWFNVTNVPSGTYVIEAEVNAERFFAETSYANNSAAREIVFTAPTPSTPTPSPTPSTTVAASPTRTPTATSEPAATPTATASPTPSQTRTATLATTTPVPTVTGTRTITPSPTTTGGGTLGGQNLSLRGGDGLLSWLDGNSETGYLVARLASSGTLLFPTNAPLAPNTTSTTDPFGLAEPFICYIVLPLGLNGALGLSDLLCLFPHTASGALAAQQFTLQMNQSTTARLTWAPPGGLSGFVIVALPLNGQPARIINVDAGASSAQDDTDGVPTCYVGLTMVGGSVGGNTDLLCGGYAGIATVGSAASSPEVLALGSALQDAASALQHVAREP
jgi:hypothetical protein